MERYMRYAGRKLLAFGLAVSMLIFSGAKAEEPPMQLSVPNMAVLPKIQTKLTISKSGKAKVSGSVKEESSTQEMKGTVFLEKYSLTSRKWKRIKKWDIVKKGSGMSFSFQHKLPKKRKKDKKKGKYRVRVKLLRYSQTGVWIVARTSMSKTKKY